MKQRILDGALGFFLASAILLGAWLWLQTYVQQEYLFHQKWDSDDFQRDLDRRIEGATFKYHEVQKQKPLINKEMRHGKVQKETGGD